MFEFLSKLFDTSGFPPRWNCGTWSAGHGWLHICADLAIFGAYVAIPIVLIYFLLNRDDVPLTGVFWLFGAFILLCGATHLIEATIFWEPWYRLSGLLKALTAVVSWATVFALGPTVKKAIHLPGLAKINEELQNEIDRRQTTEEELKLQADRMHDYTAELEAFTQSVVDREERVLELKQEVNAALVAAGESPRYASTGVGEA